MTACLCIALLLLVISGPNIEGKGATTGMVVSLFTGWALAIVGCAFALAVIERGWP